MEMNTPVAVYSPHPLMPARDRQLLHAHFEPGETLGGYLERTGIAARIRHRPVLVTIDGLRVPRSFWQHCRPKPGTLIQVQALVHGGDGKNPIATVLIIALMVYAPYLAPELAAAYGGTAAVWQAGIMVVGGMAINAAFPPPNPQLSQGALGQQAESPTYSLSGGSNRMRPYEPMPVIMGAHRIFPDLGARTYTEFEGEDQYLYQVFDFGYNDLDLSDYKIGTNPIADFSGVTLQESGADGALTLFPANVDSQAGVALTPDSVWYIRNSSPGVTALSVEIGGSLFAVDTSTGALAVAAGCMIEIEYRAIGAASWLPFWQGASAIQIIKYASRSPVRETYKIFVALGQYEVRVRRTEPETGSDSNVKDIAWSQLRSYQPDTADYTGRKRVALKIKASGQLNGSVSQFSAIARAKCLTWTGAAWVTAATSNPAWWVLAAIRGQFTGTRRVWGGGIPEARIGLDNIKAFGAWCDSKGLTFNGVFDRQMSVYDMLSAIALRGRGTVSRGSGLVEVVWDAPDQAAVAVFGMSNIKLDTFEIEYSTGQLADEIVATFINPDTDWQQDVVRVLAPDVTDPVRSRSMDLFGCTNKVEAGHTANLYVAANVHRTKRYRWQMDWEGMPVSRGEVGYLSHDLASYDYSGRLIEGSTAAALKLERTVPLDAAGSFVTIVKPDGTFATYAVAAGTGDSSTLTLAASLAFNPGADADHPPYDYRWLYGNTATPGKKIKIDSISIKGYDTVELTAIDETADYYASEDNPYTHVPVSSTFNNAPSISNLQLTEDGVRVGQGYLVKVIVTWDTGPGFSFADVSVSKNGAPSEIIGQNIRARSFEFNTDDGSDLVVDVIGYGNIGRLGASTKASISQNINFASLSPPSDVSSFTLDGGSFNWTAVSDVDVVGYKIRFHYGERFSAGDANLLHTGLLTSGPYTPDVLPWISGGQTTFMINAVDAAGLESTTPAYIVTGLGDAPVANVVETFNFKSGGFLGTITNGSIVAGDLVADATSSFYDENDNAPAYGADSDPAYGVDNYMAMTFESDIFMITAALSGSAMTLAATIAGDAVSIEYRASTPAYGADADPAYGADDSSFYDAPTDWVQWPGKVIVLNDGYQLKVVTGSGPIQGDISALTATVDAPDVTEVLNDVVTAAGGTNLTLTKTFTSIKSVQLTLEDDGGTAVSARSLDKAAVGGPLVDCINGAQTSVIGLVDAVVQGY